MPVYDYRCGSCRHTFECRQGFDSEPFARCPKCSAIAHRQLHCPPIIFKGSGFYITDNRKDGGAEKPKRAKKEEAGEAKVETKAKAEDKAKTEPEEAKATK